MKNKFQSYLKKIFMLLFLIYFIYTIFSQQTVLNSYASGKEYYCNKISEEKEYKDSLIKLKNNLNSLEYIEKIAREKLGMYLPNERVYLDVEN